MAGTSTYIENQLLNEVLRGTNYTPPPIVYIALYSSTPSSADTGTEIAGGGYQRSTVTFTAASNGVIQNSADVNFPNMPQTTVGHIGIRDAQTGGNLLFFGQLAVAKSMNSGDTFIIKAGDLQIALS